MIINYYAEKNGLSFRTNPLKLNKWLCDWIGYDGGGNLTDLRPVALYAMRNGVDIRYETTTGRNDSLLNQLLCEGYPQILRVKANGHSVVATGASYVEDMPSWRVNDPSYYKGLQYYFDYQKIKVLLPSYVPLPEAIDPSLHSSVKRRDISLSAIVASLHASAEFIVTDPSGKKTGTDPNTGQNLEQIPSSVYYSSFIRDESGHSTPESKVIEIQGPSNGVYEFQINGTPYPGPKIRYANVRSFQKPDGSTGTSFVMRIFGPSPEDIQSITATGPSGSFNLNPSNTSREFGLYYVYSQGSIVADGDYTFFCCGYPGSHSIRNPQLHLQ